MHVHLLPVLKDNYVCFLRDESSGVTAVVDPAVAPEVLRELERLGWGIDFILNTHHHPDHVGGNLELKAATGCRVVGHRKDRTRIPGLDIEVGEGERFRLGQSEAVVWDISGHTQGHIGYFFESSGDFFCGDTVFGFGCGRLFEGTVEQMWSALRRVRALPPATKLWCAHEYTEANGHFACAVAPEDRRIRERFERVRAQRAAGRSTVPLNLGEELETNPFLCERVLLAHSPGQGENLNQALLEGFRVLRRAKDNF